MPTVRTRLTVALVSLAALCLELALMRVLSLRFWSHFAYMVISVAILGFGASGTALSLTRRLVTRNRQAWLFAAALAFAVVVPAASLLARRVPLNVQFTSVWLLEPLRIPPPWLPAELPLNVQFVSVVLPLPLHIPPPR